MFYIEELLKKLNILNNTNFLDKKNKKKFLISLRFISSAVLVLFSLFCLLFLSTLVFTSCKASPSNISLSSNSTFSNTSSINNNDSNTCNSNTSSNINTSSGTSTNTNTNTKTDNSSLYSNSEIKTKKPYLRDELPIIGLHAIEDKIDIPIELSTDNFDYLCRTLKQFGFETITFKDLLDYIDFGYALPEKSVIITSDDGYADLYTNAFPILKKYNYKMTVFIVTDAIKESENQRLTNYFDSDRNVPVRPMLIWPEIKEMDGYGCEFLSHSANHIHLGLAGDEEFKLELTKSKQDIEKHLGKPVLFFAWPYDNYSKDKLKYLPDLGYRGAVRYSGGIEKLSTINLMDIKRIEFNSLISPQIYAGYLNLFDIKILSYIHYNGKTIEASMTDSLSKDKTSNNGTNINSNINSSINNSINSSTNSATNKNINSAINSATNNSTNSSININIKAGEQFLLEYKLKNNDSIDLDISSVEFEVSDNISLDGVESSGTIKEMPGYKDKIFMWVAGKSGDYKIKAGDEINLILKLTAKKKALENIKFRITAYGGYINADDINLNID